MTSQARGSVLTVCPFCACGCGLYVQRTNGAISGVMPSEHHPVSSGGLCARGWAAHEAPVWGRRLTRPMVRHGDRLEPVTWDAALAAAVQRLREIVTAGRAIGVLGSGRATNEENFLAARLARGALHSPHVDACLRAQTQSLLSGLAGAETPIDLTGALANLARADVILLVEDDLAESHPRAALAVLRAVRAGARLVTLGVARTQLSRLAWRHLSRLPDEVPRLPAEVRAAYAAASRGAVVLAAGGSAAALGALATAFATLATDTGQRHRAGSVLLPLPVRANARGALEMGVTPSLLPGLAPLSDAPARRRLAEVWGGDVNADPGLDVEAMLDDVGALIVLADDVPAGVSSCAAARAALADQDCLVVLDAFATETSRLAHVVLPIASPLESSGSFTSAEGRVQRLRAAAPPPGEARPGWRVLDDLAAALGLRSTHESIEDVQREIRAAIPGYDEALRASDNAGAVVLSPAQLEALAAARPESPPTAEAAGGAAEANYPFRLVRSGAFEWGDDPLVDQSPTLRRDQASMRKRFPDGVVGLNDGDARRLGVRDGWRVKVASPFGEAVVPIVLRPDIEPGVVAVPFGFRDRLEPVLRRGALVAARVERV